MKDNITKRSFPKKFYIIYIPIVGILTFSLAFAAKKSSAFAEWYATHIYTYLQAVVCRITGLVPFSIYELLIWTFIILVIFFLIVFIRSVIHSFKNKSFKATGCILVRAVAFVLTVFLLYTVNSGINYHRYPFSYYSGLTIEKRSVDDLLELCNAVIDEANSQVQFIDTKEMIMDDENFGQIFTTDYLGQDEGISSSKALRNYAREAMTNLGNTYPMLKGYYPQPKTFLLSVVMSYENITGVYAPFTMEATYNNLVPDYVEIFTMCHELSHLTGFMREDEANFLGYLACITSDNININYAGNVNAIVYLLNALYGNCDNDTYYALYDRMDPQIIRDIHYNNMYWKKYETPVAEVSDAVNNAYLKSNGQSDGVKSYGRVVDLMLAYYFQNK